MIRLVRTDSKNHDFIQLVQYLDADLAERDGKEHTFYAAFNKIDNIKFAIVAYDDEMPVACGAMKEYTSTMMEMKRMFVAPESRGKGVATKILSGLESWARELSFTICILETGKRQPEAIQLYRKSGYELMPNYGPYTDVENSVCFKKEIK